MDPDELTRVARRAAEEGARTAMSWHTRTTDRDVREKSGPRDLVSRADLETEQAIRDVLARERPDDGVLGEEGGRSEGTSGVTWLVDPIDGTTSYLYGRSDWAVSVAALDSTDRVVSAAVAEPVHRRLTWASAGQGSRVDGQDASVTTAADIGEALVEVNFGRPAQHRDAGRMVGALLPHVRDLRRGGSAAAALAHVAAGRADAVWSPGLQPWDGAAGLLLVLEAGGVVGDLDGPTDGRWPESGDVLAASPALWEPLREILARVYSG